MAWPASSPGGCTGPCRRPAPPRPPAGPRALPPLGAGVTEAEAPWASVCRRWPLAGGVASGRSRVRVFVCVLPCVHVLTGIRQAAPSALSTFLCVPRARPGSAALAAVPQAGTQDSRGPSHCLQVSSEEALPSCWRPVRRPRGTHGRSGPRSPGLPRLEGHVGAPLGSTSHDPGSGERAGLTRAGVRGIWGAVGRTVQRRGRARGPRAGRWGLRTWGWWFPAPQRGPGGPAPFGGGFR